MGRPFNVEPTDKQLEVLELIIRHVEEYGYQPSQSEMAQTLGCAVSSINQRLQGLADRSIIELPSGSRERAVKLRYTKFKALFQDK